MATFISLHIKSENRVQIAQLLQELSNIAEVYQGIYPKELDSSILLGDNTDPTFMAVGNVQNGWTTIHLNSFKKLHSWIETISKRLDTSVINIMGQSTSDIYYFLLYERGVLRREIEIYYGDLNNAIDKGEHFSFEKPSLIPVDDEDYENIFDMDSIERYCKEFGFDLFSEHEPDFYIILKHRKIGKTVRNYVSSHLTKKPWWKFW